MKSLIWFAWLFGMFIPFGIKYANFMLNSDPARFSFLISTLRFLFADTKVATTTFIATSLELLIGAWYIEDLPLTVLEGVQLPKHWAGALFLAAILEVVAPIIVRGIVSWTVDKVNRLRGIQTVQKPTEE